MNIKPLSDYVVIKTTTEEVTKSGIVLPDTVNKEKPEKGEVIAIGDGRLLENGQKAPMNVKIGDIVMFRKYSPDEIKIEGEAYLIVKESDIIAIIGA
jgi:chaperonin GroES